MSDHEVHDDESSEQPLPHNRTPNHNRQNINSSVNSSAIANSWRSNLNSSSSSGSMGSVQQQLNFSNFSTLSMISSRSNHEHESEAVDVNVSNHNRAQETP